MNDNQENIVALRQAKEKELILGQLRRIPIIQVACEKAGIARATFYRLRNDDPNFKRAVEEAVGEGVAFITDMSESQLIILIKEKNWPAISFWLRHHHPNYTNKLEIVGSSLVTYEELTPEQEKLVKRALELASFDAEPNPIENNDNKQSGTTKSDRADDQR